MTASNYPPGVTGNEPQIAGERHYRECPLHEDNPWSHECGEGTIPIRYNDLWPRGWHLDMGTLQPSILYCPYCGEELPVMACRCAEIAEADKETAEEYKEQFRHDNNI